MPGVALAIVRDGSVLLLQGYGWADPEKRVPIDAERTIFRIGSVSKLFTAVAALKLAEEGRLDLGEDVNRYLGDFPMVGDPRRPITAHHLMTHTAGLDDRYVGIASLERQLPLEVYLEDRLPRQVRPAGTFMAYSNHGYALLGLLVEKLHRDRFADVIEREILDPLGMTSSSFRLRPGMRERLASGYESRNGRYEPVPYDYFHIAPASSLHATASDMVVFMQALLSEGGDLLRPETASAMMGRQFTHDPRLPGRGYGFHERFVNGRRAVAHAGGLRGFSSYLILFPEERLGVFLMMNRFEDGLREAFVKRFTQRFLPAVETRFDAKAEAATARLDGLAGSYRSLRLLSESSFEKLMMLFSTYRLERRDDTVVLHAPQEKPRTFRLLGDQYLESPDDEQPMSYRTNGKGDVTHMFLGAEAYQKLTSLEEPAFHRSLFKWFTLFFQGAVLLWLGLTAARRWLARSSRSPRGARLSRAWRWTGLVPMLNVVFLVGLGAIASSMDPYDFLYGMPSALAYLHAVPLVAVALTLVSGYELGHGVVRRESGWKVEFLYILSVIGAALAFAVFLDYWNLLGYRF